MNDIDEITLTYPDGTTKQVKKGITGVELAKSISRKLAENALAIKVDDKLSDLDVPLTQDATIKIITFADPEGVEVFRHSTAHILAYAIQQLYPEAKNTIGPAVEEGFYYDFDELNITQEDLPKIEKKMKEIVDQGLVYQRKEITLEDVRKTFPNNKYKMEMASEFKIGGQTLTAYAMGDNFIDLCR